MHDAPQEEKNEMPKYKNLLNPFRLRRFIHKPLCPCLPSFVASSYSWRLKSQFPSMKLPHTWQPVSRFPSQGLTRNPKAQPRVESGSVGSL